MQKPIHPERLLKQITDSAPPEEKNMVPEIPKPIKDNRPAIVKTAEKNYEKIIGKIAMVLAFEYSNLLNKDLTFKTINAFYKGLKLIGKLIIVSLIALYGSSFFVELKPGDPDLFKIVAEQQASDIKQIPPIAK